MLTVDPCRLSPLTFSFICLDMASGRVCSGLLWDRDHAALSVVAWILLLEDGCEAFIQSSGTSHDCHNLSNTKENGFATTSAYSLQHPQQHADGSRGDVRL